MITRATKNSIYQRDKYQCVKCKSTKSLTIDHKVPISEGGSDRYENLQTLCYPCNYAKGNIFSISWKDRLTRIWTVFEYTQDWKNEMRSFATISTKNITEEMQGYVKVMNGRHNALQAGMDKNRNKLQEQLDAAYDRIRDLEKSVILLTQYLDVTCVSTPESGVTFIKNEQ